MRPVGTASFIVHEFSDCILYWTCAEIPKREPQSLQDRLHEEEVTRPLSEWLQETIDANRSDAHHLLGDPPGPGLWIFEGDVMICGGPSSHYEGVCDCGEEYVGTWRRLTTQELEALATGDIEHV